MMLGTSWEIGGILGALAILAALAVAIGRIHSLKKERVLLGSALVEVSERLRAFREDETRFREIVNALPDPVILRDDEGEVTVNHSYTRLLPPVDGPEGDREPKVVGTRPGTVRADGTRIVDEAIATPDGLRWFSWSDTRMQRPDGSRAVLRTGREITDRVTAERALEQARVKAEAASEAKSRFLATVSHEFRTPLSGILGMADLLNDTNLDAEQRSYVGAVKGSAEAFLSLIEEILDFSRIEAGRIDLVDEPFDVEAVVQGVTELLAPRAQDKGIGIACHVAAEIPRLLVGDRDRLRQILFNLAGNAVKFTREGGVGIAVERAPDGAILFCVRDTGPGIAADQLPLIFNEFEQGGLVAEREIGTGLGLAITRRIVDRMAGTITVDSTPGHGSAFTIRLPLPASGAELAAPAALPRGYGVLAVGPCPFGPAFIARRVAEAGGRPDHAATPAEAERKLVEGRVDCIVVDWALGEAAVRAIAAAADRAGVTRRVVLLSPFDRRAVGSAHAIGFDAHLIKPVRTASLIERVRPDAPAAPRFAAAQGRPARPARATRTGAPRVLLAEDNDVNALLAMKSLEKLGALVHWAKNGTDALAAAEATLTGRHPPFDLILMDVRMPGLDGLAVTRRIRAREAELGRHDRCRIVALTASLLEGDSRLDEDVGFDGFLSKPFAQDAIARELRFSESFKIAS